jgi:CheY-like chemotaxis protein
MLRLLYKNYRPTYFAKTEDEARVWVQAQRQRLPEVDGYEVARTLRADPQLVRVTLVAVTGNTGPMDMAKAQRAGFDGHLAKPPSMEALQKVLAAVGPSTGSGRTE